MSVGILGCVAVNLVMQFSSSWKWSSGKISCDMTPQVFQLLRLIESGRPTLSQKMACGLAMGGREVQDDVSSVSAWPFN